MLQSNLQTKGELRSDTTVTFYPVYSVLWYHWKVTVAIYYLCVDEGDQGINRSECKE